MRIKIKSHNKKKNRTGAGHGKEWQRSWTRPWMAMGTFAAYSFIGSQSFVPVFAQSSTPTGQTAQISVNLPARRFDIPAGALDAVLAAFRAATDIVVTVPNPGILSLMSPGVSGTFTPDQALRRLLSDTGVDYRFTAESAVTVQLKAVSTSVDVVTTVEALAASSPKYGSPILDTPQTINTVTQEVMQQQGTTTLRDALRNVAGISIAAGEGSSQGDNLTIRGFSARNDLYIDGMRDFGSYYRDPFNTQEVEVLQGPSSVTFGRGSTGGVVNQATKMPALSKLVSGDIDFGTDLTRRGTLDFETPVPKLGKGAAFRINLMGNENKIAERDIAENRRWGVAPSLAFGLGTNTRGSINYFHQYADDTPDYGIPWLFNQAAPVNHHNYYGFSDANHLRTQADIGTAKIEHDFNSHFTIRNQFRDANYHRDVLITEPRVAGAVTLATPLAAIQVTRNQLGAISDETFLDNQLDLMAHFKTGFIQHSFVAGAEGGRETSDPTRPTWTNIPTASLLGHYLTGADDRGERFGIFS
jgi:catecholate siderophore receptor